MGIGKECNKTKYVGKSVGFRKCFRRSERVARFNIGFIIQNNGILDGCLN